MTIDYLALFKHLLPRGRAWQITIDKVLRQFFTGLGALPEDLRDYIDDIYADLFPATTRDLNAWEYQWGLPDTDLTEEERRDRLAATWAQIGGQDPKYIQDTVQAAGFGDVYIHEWWVPASSPVEARNPLNWLIGEACECDEDIAECGEAGAACGERTAQGNFPSWLVNKQDIAGNAYTIRCGEALAECGEAGAQCGEYDGFQIERKEYAIPLDPDYWPYFLYFGGQVFGESTMVYDARQAEFENLLLKLCPTQQWIGLFIEYVAIIVEDATQDPLIEDDSGDFLTE